MSSGKTAPPNGKAEEKNTAKQRSPNFPGIDLREAVERARTMFEKEGPNAVPPSVLQTHWGYSAKSSSGMIAIGALRKFGLIDGSPNVRLTQLALEILNPSSPSRTTALRKAALTPGLHKDLWTEYKGQLPSDDTLSFRLRGLQFTVPGAKTFIAQFRSTLAFAGLTGDTEKADIPTDGGEDQRTDEDERGNPPAGFASKLPAERPGMNQDIFTLDEGQVVLQWPARISPESYADLKDWLDLMARKVKRAVRVDDAEAKSPREE